MPAVNAVERKTDTEKGADIVTGITEFQINEISTLCFLIYSSWKDLKKREISLWLTGIYGALGILLCLIQKRPFTDLLVPFGIGVLILFFSILTKGEVGMGDGWILLALGFTLDMELYLKTVCIGMLLAAAWSGVLLIICRKNRKTEIPLVPFLLLGYAGGLFL